jgi:hypothetical protein
MESDDLMGATMQPHHDSPQRRSGPSPGQLGGRALARQKLIAMHRRARRIRRLVAGLAAATFTAAFLAVYVQLASGHDPALSATKRNSTSATRQSGTSARESSGSSASGGESSSSSSASGGESAPSSSSGSGESSSGPSAVTTAQS